jgi:hypothetical protein
MKTARNKSNEVFCFRLSGRAGFFSEGKYPQTFYLFSFHGGDLDGKHRQTPGTHRVVRVGPLRLVQHETQTAAAMAGGWPTAKRPLNFPSNDSKPMRNNGPMNNENKKLVERWWLGQKWKTVDRNNINIC